MLPIEDWHDFYLTTGAGAAAILGATFIVATLVANARQRTIGLKGFVTPTAVHLGSVFAGQRDSGHHQRAACRQQGHVQGGP